MVPPSFQKISAVLRELLRFMLVAIFFLCSCTSPCIPLCLILENRHGLVLISTVSYLCAQNRSEFLRNPSLEGFRGLRLAFSFSRFGLAPTKMPQLL